LVDLAEIQAAYYMVAATGVLVAAIYYVYNMRISQRNQALSLKSQQQTLETRQAQLFMQLYSQYYDKDWLEALRKTTFDIKFQGFDEWSEKYGAHANPEAYKSMDLLSHYFEGAGVLVRRGLIDPSLVSDLVSEEFVDYWEKFGPLFKEYRVRSNNPRLCENQEYLYDLLKSVYPRGALTAGEVEKAFEKI
jgi:hypothetical protein